MVVADPGRIGLLLHMNASISIRLHSQMRAHGISGGAVLTQAAWGIGSLAGSLQRNRPSCDLQLGPEELGWRMSDRRPVRWMGMRLMRGLRNLCAQLVWLCLCKHADERS